MTSSNLTAEQQAKLAEGQQPIRVIATGKEPTPPRGLGDTIHSVLKTTGITKLVGDCGGCEQRRQWLNRHFPYQ